MVRLAIFAVAALGLTHVAALPSSSWKRTEHQMQESNMMEESSSMGMESHSMDSMKMEEEKMAMESETSSAEYMPAETNTYMAETTSEYKPMETQMYGSGSMDQSSYNDCVEQCMAKYGAPPSMYTAPAQDASASESGDGAVHTVIVAPAQGVLRYVPPFLNASVGDTIKFMWNANVHTVTKSSQLTPCNKTADKLFTSGSQNKSFEFTQKINDTDQTFFFCNTPGHCSKGMFGIINPNNVAVSANTSMAMMMATYAQSPDIAAYNSYTQKMTANNTQAASWGSNLDMSSMPDWAGKLMAENVMYTRNFLAMNPDIQQDDGSIDMSAMGSNPAMIPQDVGAALSNAASGSASSSTPPVSSATSSAAAIAGAASTDAPQPNSAGAMASPKVLTGVMAAFATYLLV